jgi:hypothetical protein
MQVDQALKTYTENVKENDKWSLYIKYHRRY